MQIKQIEKLKSLVKQNPTSKYYIELLVKEFAQVDDWRSASQCYADYLDLVDNDAEAYFNHAYNLRFSGEYEKAITQYRTALSLNIAQPEEVYLNIAVIYSDYLRLETDAKIALEQALTLNKQYIPALYNLANLYEDAGDKELAAELFEKIIILQPKYYDALARLAQINKVEDPQAELICKLVSANKDVHIDISEKININFALGKVFDDCGEYDSAFLHFKTANLLDQKISNRYNKAIHEEYIEQIIKIFSNSVFNEFSAISNAHPIFICGMFRSGSTLVEQILAAHPEVSAGGEREFFLRLIENSLSPFPQSLLELSISKFQKIADEYLNDLAKAFPDAVNIIDKRPENYLYIGLIKILFPNARIIYTQRNALDNCLSVYFLRLGGRMNYALSLENTAHYYKQQAKLMAYWQDRFKGDIYTLNYDELVSNSEEEIKGLIHYLQLDWHSNCLNFHEMKNRVKTASVWQVRKPLYASSSGRWKNYQKHISELIAEF
ncbi:MAG: sulfotransferase [Colwellia sp.]|nr:sulfotransferase [Colwellia sp.]